MSWDPGQYARFADERRRPWTDLVDMVRPRAGMRVVDLGCGTGELTRALHDRIGADFTVGVDRSPEMLAEAARWRAERMAFVRADLARFGAGPFDLVLSNAALHWVPDHPSLFARLTELMAPGAQLAVQVPANQHHLSHVVAREVAAELGVVLPASPVLPAIGYANLLERLGYVEQRVRLEVYAHHLPSREAVIEWVKGTVLVPVREALGTEAGYEEFVRRYRDRLLPMLEDRRPYFYPYPRILMWATRPS